MSIWLIGAGVMAQDYAKVLISLGRDFKVIGRNNQSANNFESIINLPVNRGGVSAALSIFPAPIEAIISVGVENLASVAMDMIKSGTRRILLEKPGGINSEEICKLQNLATAHNAEVLIAYNRRFYSSTILARNLIAEDGGATSCSFEFTEWSHVLGSLDKPTKVKEAWFLANSTHVVDLAFHLCGLPKNWHGWRGGSVNWHPSAARFCGAGITERGVFFSYTADWEAPGRWGIEVQTRKRRFIFRPMEELHVVKMGSVVIEKMNIDDRWDQAFKPGLYQQVTEFLNRNDKYFCTINDQLQNVLIYDQMAGYNQVKD
jgi:predicted dehydrogenase